MTMPTYLQVGWWVGQTLQVYYSKYVISKLGDREDTACNMQAAKHRDPDDTPPT